MGEKAGRSAQGALAAKEQGTDGDRERRVNVGAGETTSALACGKVSDVRGGCVSAERARGVGGRGRGEGASGRESERSERRV